VAWTTYASRYAIKICVSLWLKYKTVKSQTIIEGDFFMKARTEWVVLVASILIAIMVLMLTLTQIKQTELMQDQLKQTEKHYKLSVYPQVDILTIDYSKTCSRPAEITIDLENSGVGPAVFHNTKYCINENCFSRASELTIHLRKLSGLGRDVYKSRAFDKFNNSILKAGDQYTSMRLYDFYDEEAYNTVRKLAAGITVTVEYANIYGDMMQPSSEDASSLKSQPVGFEICK
jgi:hypothetical protein